MQFSDLFDRVRRFTFASICFLIASFLVRKGNAFDGGSSQLIVPAMCVVTALLLCMLGLALFVKSDPAND